MIGSYCTTILYVLILASDMTNLYENDFFPILILSTKTRYFSYLKKCFVFLKICFKVEVLKTYNVSTDCHIKTCRSFKWSAILKIPITAF